MEIEEDHYGHSSFGLEENVVAAFSYFFIGPIVYVKEQRSHYVKFHALQASLGFLLLSIFWLVVHFVSFLSFMSWAPGLTATAFCLYMMHKAYDGEEYKLPVIGSFAYNTIFDATVTDEDLLTDEENTSSAENSKG